MTRTKIAAAFLALAALAGCAGMMAAPPDYNALLAASDRSDADRKTDARRKPAEMLAFIGPRPGMKVLDLATGGGYSTELMARAVGPTGVVYGQDAPTTVPNARNAFDARAKSPAMKNVVRLFRSFDDPVPPQVRDLDLITFLSEYHEMSKAKTDRVQMNRRLFEILKPGGVLVVADHSARPGDPASIGETLHRVDENLVRQEVEAAGFRFVAEGNFLRNPADTRDTPIFKSPVPVDDFYLKFEKPR
jgi:predicted methyltransferase